MIDLEGWQAAPAVFVLLIAATLLIVWWRQQTYRWAIVLALCLIAAPALSWWSTQSFEVPDYRAGCDGVCPGFRGAPVPTQSGELAGANMLPVGFSINTIVYLVLLLGWSAIVRAALLRLGQSPRGAIFGQTVLGVALVLCPVLLAPWYLPAPEAHVRGDAQRISINARREVYLYDHRARFPVLRVALTDVRPRSDGQSGMRVCLRAYTFFYLPAGNMYLDMTPEGVHSNNGGVLPLSASCWQ